MRSYTLGGEVATAAGFSVEGRAGGRRPPFDSGSPFPGWGVSVFPIRFVKLRPTVHMTTGLPHDTTAAV